MENLTWTDSGSYLLAHVTGEITMELTPDLKRDVEKALESCTYPLLVLDLSEVSFMDSSGIGFLVACNTRMQSLGKTLALLHPSSQVRKTLGLVQLMDFFRVAETEQDLASPQG